MKVTLQELREFNEIIQDLENEDMVKQLRNFIQHCDTSRYEHCKNVAFYSYLICKKYNLDYVAAARGGMLHDLFLYDWRDKASHANLKRCHAFEHPRVALENSNQLFCLTDKEKDIIVKHMWPVTLSLPRYKESYIITLVDKYCASKESFSYFRKKYRLKELYRFGYVLLSMLIIRF